MVVTQVRLARLETRRRPCSGSHPGTPTHLTHPPHTGAPWPAWKCLHHPYVSSHPGIPTPRDARRQKNPRWCPRSLRKRHHRTTWPTSGARFAPPGNAPATRVCTHFQARQPFPYLHCQHQVRGLPRLEFPPATRVCAHTQARQPFPYHHVRFLTTRRVLLFAPKTSRSGPVAITNVSPHWRWHVFLPTTQLNPQRHRQRFHEVRGGIGGASAACGARPAARHAVDARRRGGLGQGGAAPARGDGVLGAVCGLGHGALCEGHGLLL